MHDMKGGLVMRKDLAGHRQYLFSFERELGIYQLSLVFEDHSFGRVVVF
jgi:hypothetical protein